MPQRRAKPLVGGDSDLQFTFVTSQRGLAHRLRLTGRAAVAAHVVPRHPLHLSQDGLGQLLHDVVLADVVVALEGLVQRLLLAVLQHRDPAGGGRRSVHRRRREEEI